MNAARIALRSASRVGELKSEKEAANSEREKEREEAVS